MLQTCFYLKPLRHVFYLLFLAFLFLFFLQDQSLAAEPLLKKVSILLNWKHQYEFAGYYAAKEKGYYQDAGLEVTIREFEQGIDVVEEVLSGKAQFGTFYSDLLLASVKGKPVSMMANFFKYSPLALVTHPDIRLPADLRGKRVMGVEHELRGANLGAMFKHFDLSPDDFTIVPNTFTIEPFASGKVDAMTVFLTNEIYHLQKDNIEYNILSPFSFGIPSYDGNLFTSTKMASTEPDVVRKFRDASIHGWQYAIDHPDELIDLILTKYSQQKSRAALQFEAAEIRKAMLHKTFPIGSINPNQLLSIVGTYKELGLISQSATLDSFVFESFEKPVIPFSQEEERYLAKRTTIRFCVDPDWMPFEAIDSNGNLIGMSADFIPMIEEQVGVAFELVPTQTWQQTINFAKEKKCDIISMAMQTEEREKYLNFTRTYLDFAQVIATRNDELFIEDLAKVLNRSFGVVQGYAHKELLERKYPSIQLREVANVEDGLRQVQAGKLFGFLDAAVSITYVIQREDLDGLKISGKLVLSQKLSLAVRNDDPLLLTILDKVVADISDERIREVYNKWGKVTYLQRVDYGLLWKILAVVAALFAMGFYRNRQLTQLNTQIQDTNKELQREIAERVEAEKEREKSESTYRALVETTDTGYLILDGKGKVLDANQEYIRQTGHQTLKDILGRSITEWTAPHDLERNAEEVMKCMGAGYIRDLQIDYVDRDGAITPVEINAKVVDTAEGIRILTLCRDISERKRTEERLIVLFRAIETSLDALIIADLDGKITYTNKALTDIYGYTQEELLGTPVAELAHDKSFTGDVILREIRETDGWQGERESARKDGTVFPALLTSSLVFGHDNKPIGMLGIIKDLTEIKASEKRKTVLEKQLQQAQKMEAIGTLAGGIAHDFNNMLAVIIGYAEMASETATEDPTLHADLDKVLLAANRAKNLVAQILAFSRQAESEKIYLQPQAIVKEAIKLLRSSIPTTITITQSIKDGCGMIKADPTQLHQVIMNLCTNAYHAMEEHGGTLAIALERTELSPDDLHNAPSLLPGPYVQLTVSDTGPGIDPAVRERIFDPFFTTKEVNKGTGMGLAMVHGIMKNHGGMIRCQSEIGQGTTFQVFFPETTKVAENRSDTDSFIPTGSERILFVDDETLLADMGKQLLERLGYSVTAVTESKVALELFRSQPDQFDLVITDQTMPGMTGSDLAQEILSIQPTMPIILCTGYSSIISKEKALSMGIRKFVMKPMVKKDIAPLLRQIFDDF